MHTADSYIQQVLHNLQASPEDCERIRMDLQAHFRDALTSGERIEDVINRMGTPQEIAAGFMAQQPFNYASFWQRLAAGAFDMAAVLLTAFGLSMAAVYLANRVPQHPAGVDYVVGGLLIVGTAALGLSALGLILLYFPLLEGRFGQTLGKKLLHLHVRKENGLPVGYKEAFLRRLSYYFEFLPVDALFIFFTARSQRALDIVARTIVVKGR